MAVCAYRVREAIKGKVAVVDVDGSYLVRKHEQLRQAGVNVAPLGPPSLPLSGWITINEANYKDESQKIPRMLPGTSTSPATPASLSLSLSQSCSPYVRVCTCKYMTTILLSFSRSPLCLPSRGSWTLNSC